MNHPRRVWDDLASSPEEADDLARRADLIISLENFVTGQDPQAVGRQLGVDPLIIGDIQTGHISRLPLPLLEQVRVALLVDGATSGD